MLGNLRGKTAAFWRLQRERQCLSLFQAAARRVPAYKDFLHKHKINPNSIRTWADFFHVPLMDKKNYLRQYPLEALCWDGTLLDKNLVFTSTSGSTGEPFFFPRSFHLDWQYSFTTEYFLKNSSHGIDGPILVIIGFGMGVWIGGLITYRAFEIAGRRTRIPLSIITPGSNKDEILSILEKLGPHFKQIILTGYPPFVKDVIDEGRRRSMDLERLRLRLFFAAEGFSDAFRSYLGKQACLGNIYRDTLNIYGSADIGAMASETPFSIFVRQYAHTDQMMHDALFPAVTKIPTLAQYNPLFITFESVDGAIALNGNNTIPLIRYAIGDHGGVFDYDQPASMLTSVTLSEEEKNTLESLSDTVMQLPFVYVYERADFSTKLYGAIIYAEHVRVALQEPALHGLVTGKCTMVTKHNADYDEYLEINVELEKGVTKSKELRQKTTECVKRSLLEKNSEYHYLAQMMPQRVEPHIVFWEYGHPEHFKIGIKQRWVKNHLPDKPTEF